MKTPLIPNDTVMGGAILHGLATKPLSEHVYSDTADRGDVERRRARNKAARKSRRLNRRAAKR